MLYTTFPNARNGVVDKFIRTTLMRRTRMIKHRTKMSDPRQKKKVIQIVIFESTSAITRAPYRGRPHHTTYARSLSSHYITVHFRVSSGCASLISSGSQ